MKCPHCLVEFHSERKIIFVGEDSEGQWALEKYDCPNPECKKSIVFLLLGEFSHSNNFPHGGALRKMQ